ncbi:hypothetical protein QNI19_38045 [Cytophagaceae bacterium DM2B3-1]|uniref:Uncharacterized protein n=1 Tax=Xanthocytophaga flava TaxID=3048013 RepID=A0ABT7CYE4_9BACT|nr:hypothetical protein [Xanthocytophaga flavus]MDJ1498794.1 hypothetical protein [Xanthocytophaga flavus]
MQGIGLPINFSKFITYKQYDIIYQNPQTNSQYLNLGNCFVIGLHESDTLYKGLCFVQSNCFFGSDYKAIETIKIVDAILQKYQNDSISVKKILMEDATFQCDLFHNNESWKTIIATKDSIFSRENSYSVNK